MAASDNNIIKEGDYVIVQRHDFMKIHKLGKKMIVNLGKDEVDIAPVIGEQYWTTFKMELKPKGKRSFILKKCDGVVSVTDEIIKDLSSGVDNRNIVDDSSSQKLSTEEIQKLREDGVSAQGIVTQLIENSKTFLNKTEYSQEKYLKKKEKKYYEYITIKKPTFRLIAEVYLKQPQKILGMRSDTISQLTTLANVTATGTYLLYETGCSGIVAAALIDRINENGTIIHVHPGSCEHPAHSVLSLNLEKEHLDRLISVDIHKLIRSKVKNSKQATASEEKGNEPAETVKESAEKIEELSENVKESDEKTEESAEKVCLGKRKLEEDEPKTGWKKKRREENEEKAISILKEKKADALLIVGREDPINIFHELIDFVEISRPFVVYSSVREPLQELYCELKLRNDIIAIRLTESWLRGYQVLPDRTHPDINISGSGGFLLSGFKVSDEKI